MRPAILSLLMLATAASTVRAQEAKDFGLVDEVIQRITQEKQKA